MIFLFGFICGYWFYAAQLRFSRFMNRKYNEWEREFEYQERSFAQTLIDKERHEQDTIRSKEK